MVAEEPGAAAAPKRRAPKKRRRHGEGSIYRRGKRWTGSLDLGFETAPDGTIRRRRVTVTGATADEVARELRQLQARADIGMTVQDGQTSVAAFLRSWLETTKAPGLRPRSLEHFQTHVERHLVPFLGHHKLARLEPMHVQALIADKLQAGLSVTTVRAIVITLSGALKAAQEWGLVGRNVAAMAKLPKKKAFSPKPLTGDQAKAFLGAIQGDRLEALYWLLIGTGLRRGEALGLRWQDVDLAGRVIHVRYSLQKVARGASVASLGADFIRLSDTKILTPPKTEASRTSLAIPGIVARHLAAHRERQDAERAAAGDRWQDLGLVFCHHIGRESEAGGRYVPPGGPIDLNVVGREFKTLLSAAGLPPIRLHDLRHTCAVLLIEGGDGNLKQVQKQMRHARIETTLGTYGHVSDELQARAADDMDGLLGEG